MADSFLCVGTKHGTENQAFENAWIVVVEFGERAAMCLTVFKEGYIFVANLEDLPQGKGRVFGRSVPESHQYRR